MRCPTRVALLLIAFTGTLYSQPKPVCGLPHFAGQHYPVTGQLPRQLKIDADEQSFKIRDNIFSTTYKSIDVDFRRLYADDSFEIFGEIAEIDSGRIDTSAVNELVGWFRDHTAVGSIAEGSGIKSIAEDVFGAPPDYDHNGKVYILLVDVREEGQTDTSKTFVAGYFDPADQGGGGNGADIIYIDTHPGDITGNHTHLLMATLAHEYQHLIHYGRDDAEETWVNEGLSELSPILMGLPHRNFSYYLENTNVHLDNFENDIADYARSGMLFLYLWDRMGTSFIQDLIINTGHGIAGIDDELAVISGPEFDDLVFDWHIENMLPSAGGYGERFGISIPELSNVISSYPYDEQDNVYRLGARWSMISGGENLYVRSGGAGAIDDVQLELIRTDDYSFIYAPLLNQVGYIDTLFGSQYRDILVLATTGSDAKVENKYNLYVTATGGYTEITERYDDNNSDDEEVEYFPLGGEEGYGEAVVSFKIDESDAELSSVEFLTAISDSVHIAVYNLNGDGSRSYLHKATIFAPLADRWTTHRLPANIAQNKQTLYVSIIGWANFLAYFETSASSHSWLRLDPTEDLQPLDHFTRSTGGNVLDGNWGVRLNYLIPTNGVQQQNIPPGVGQFYPNPFIVTDDGIIKLSVISTNPNVELTIYNLIGQEIFKHAPISSDGFMSFEWDGILANGLVAPSGIYIGVIEVGNYTLGRKFTLLK